MKKDYSNKMMTEAKVKTKAEPVLTCARECVIPGVGSYKAGDRITVPSLIKHLLNHPNFETTQEETQP